MNKLIAAYFGVECFTRIILSIYAMHYGQIDLPDVPMIFVVGAINDLISIVYILPLALLLGCVYEKLSKLSRITLYSVLCFIFISNIVGESTFWDEFGTRYNFIAVDYLIYTQEVIGTLCEWLPVGPITTVLAIVSIVCAYVLVKYENTQRPSLAMIASSIIVAVCTFAFYAPDYSRCFTNNYAVELSKNGPYEFFSAFRNNFLSYSKFYKTIDHDEALSTVRSKILQKNQGFINHSDITRDVRSGIKMKKYNIVMIVIESMSAEYMGKFGNANGITPNLDKLADESIFFTNLYATGTRTVRGLEALTLGVPPTPGASIVRQENNQDLFNIGSVLKQNGYNTHFLYGGFSYFDNLENYFGGNGYKVTDRNHLSADEITFANIWGVADEDLLTKTLATVTNAPFFALVMTTSNHRPYTFPQGRIDLPSGGGRLAAVKYTDYAIGKFIEDARTKPWFDNTIFVITADHCASSAGKTELPIEKYHIPLMIYAPKILTPRVVSNLSSQIDIAPTILGILGASYKSKFIGNDILHFPADRAFISTYQLLGYFKNNHLVVLSPKDGVKTYDAHKKITRDPTLEREAISFYQLTHSLFTTGRMKNDDGQK